MSISYGNRFIKRLEQLGFDLDNSRAANALDPAKLDTRLFAMGAALF
jgi:hypothetical protein